MSCDISTCSTIVALATPPGKGAIHIIRVSGKNTYSIMNLLTKTPVKKTEDRVELNYIYSLKTREIIDQVLLIKFHAPDSYTGEDLVEINCHGSSLVVSLIIQELIACGAVLSKPGEFTKRGLLNNKITLDQVENISLLFSATSSSELLSVTKTFESGKTSQIKNIELELFNLIGKIETSIDFPSEIEEINLQETNLAKIQTQEIKDKLEDIYKNSKHVNPSAFRVLLCGRPNAGKSSLLNFLLNEEKIIVSNIPGTTRDIIEVEYFYNNYWLTIVDSAGICNTNDILEIKSIEKTKAEIQKANLIFFLISSEEKDDLINKQIEQDLAGKEYVIIYTKSDLATYTQHKDQSISVKNNDINAFYSALNDKLKDTYLPTGFKSEYMISKLFNSIQELNCVLNEALTIDLISEKLKTAREHLLDCLGVTENNEEFIQQIFDNFCVGK